MLIYTLKYVFGVFGYVFFKCLDLYVGCLDATAGDVVPRLKDVDNSKAYSHLVWHDRWVHTGPIGNIYIYIYIYIYVVFLFCFVYKHMGLWASYALLLPHGGPGLIYIAIFSYVLCQST